MPLSDELKARVVLTEDGKGIGSLYEKGHDGKTPGKPPKILSVADLVEFVHFYKVDSAKNTKGKVFNIIEPWTGELKGMKVNMIGGPTGVGKTSLIFMAAGGAKTEAKLVSDTKAPAVYIIDYKDKLYAFLDTAGMCDTEAALNKEPGMQDLLINVVPAVIQKYELEVVRMWMAVSNSHKLPPNFGEIWPAMRDAMGKSAVDKVAAFVITNTNIDADESLEDELDTLKKTPLYKTLQDFRIPGQAAWAIETAGKRNFDAFIAASFDVGTGAIGINYKETHCEARIKETREKAISQMRSEMVRLKSDLQKDGDKKAAGQKALQALRDKMDEATEQYMNAGWCPNRAKDELRNSIARMRRQVRDLESQIASGQIDGPEVQKAMEDIEASLEKEMKELSEQNWFGNIVTGCLQAVASATSSANPLAGLASAVVGVVAGPATKKPRTE